MGGTIQALEFRASGLQYYFPHPRVPSNLLKSYWAFLSLILIGSFLAPESLGGYFWEMALQSLSFGFSVCSVQGCSLETGILGSTICLTIFPIV